MYTIHPIHPYGVGVNWEKGHMQRSHLIIKTGSLLIISVEV